MPDDPLTARLVEVMVAAQRRHRTRRGVMGALTTLPIPNGLIDEVAAGMAPVLRELVQEAVHAELAAAGEGR